MFENEILVHTVPSFQGAHCHPEDVFRNKEAFDDCLESSGLPRKKAKSAGAQGSGSNEQLPFEVR